MKVAMLNKRFAVQMKQFSIGRRCHLVLHSQREKVNAWLHSFKGADTGGEFRLKPVLVDHSENSRALKSYAKSTRPVLYKWNKKPG